MYYRQRFPISALAIWYRTVSHRRVPARRLVLALWAASRTNPYLAVRAAWGSIPRFTDES